MLTVLQQCEALVRSASSYSIALSMGVGVVTYALVRLTRRATTNNYKYAQPASTLPILGNTLDLMFYHRDHVYDWFTEQSEALGRSWLLSVVGNPSAVVVWTPDALEDVLVTHFDSFVREDTGVSVLEDFFGKGILAAAGDTWYFHRKTASNLFSHQMMRDVMYETVRSSMETLERALRVYESRGKPVDLKAVIAHFTSDVFGKIGFGVDLNCIANGVAGKPGNEFIDAFAAASTALSRRMRQPKWLWRLKRFLNVGEEKIFADSMKVIDTFLFRIIDESIEKKNDNDTLLASSGASTMPPPKDLISLFLSSKVKEDEQIKAREFKSEIHLIRDTVLNFIFAGKDTTSNAMSFFIIAMNRYPAVLENIRAELSEKLPGLMTGELLLPSMADLLQLTYLEAVIRENLRLHTVVSLTPRFAMEDVVLSDGTPIPKGYRVTVCVHAANHSKLNWGDDVLEFKPERWIDGKTGKIAAVSSFKAMSFLAGPRQCIGMKFAMLEMKCALAVLASRFDFKTVEDPWSFGYQPGSTTSVKGPLLVNIISRVASPSY